MLNDGASLYLDINICDHENNPFTKVCEVHSIDRDENRAGQQVTCKGPRVLFIGHGDLLVNFTDIHNAMQKLPQFRREPRFRLL